MTAAWVGRWRSPSIAAAPTGTRSSRTGSPSQAWSSIDATPLREARLAGPSWRRKCDLGFRQEHTASWPALLQVDRPHGAPEENPMNLDFSQPSIIAMLVGSSVGYIYLSWGRSQSDYPLAASGLALMTYSYFITSMVWLVAVGVAIAVAPFAWRRIA